MTTAQIVLVTVVGGAGLWVLHTVGQALTKLLEALAAVAVVFVTAWLAVKGAWAGPLRRAALAHHPHRHRGAGVVLLVGLAIPGDHRHRGRGRAPRLAPPRSGSVRAAGRPAAARLVAALGRLRPPDAPLAARVRADRHRPRPRVSVQVNPFRRTAVRPKIRARSDHVPRVVGVRSGGSWDEVRVRLVAGQTPEDFDQSARALAVAGKNSVGWAPIVSIAPAIRDGLVRVSGIDPKGMELAYGRRVFHRYAVTSKDALALLDELIDGMEARKTAFAGRVRTVPVTREYPLELVEFDEIGALVRYVGDRKTREAIVERVALLTTQGRALGYTVRGYVQEPTKDTVPVRELFPRRICLRVASKSHVAMVLGEHAYDRGAWANRIGESEAGVGYLFGEGIREPLRVRAGWVPDQVIKQLETFVTGHAAGRPVAAGRVLTLPTPVPQPAGGAA